MSKAALRIPALLVIMDGSGLGTEGPDNAISMARRPYFKSLLKDSLYTTLGASGEDVGLPAGQMGNSEVGHLNIGAGRIVHQELSRINQAISDASIEENTVLMDCMDRVKAAGGTLHIMGLASPGGVHSSLEHGKALVELAAKSGVDQIAFDAFTDGRDTAPQSGAGYLGDLEDFLKTISERYGVHAFVASVSGRYYAMDRDNRWDRVQLAYDTLVLGKGQRKPSAQKGLLESYAQDGRGDEFVVPFLVDGTGMRDGDACVFFNFRPDRARQLTRALSEDDFAGFVRPGKLQLSSFVTMCTYDPAFQVQVAFPKCIPEQVLADVISRAGLRQFHTAETEKYAHVTFFLNGGIEEPKAGETRKLVASPKVATYDLQPEMSAYEVTEGLIQAIREDAAEFYVVNFANCDMVGHTGVLSAAVKAAEVVDRCLEKVVSAVLAKGGFACITADHGNADHMYDVVDGAKVPFTAHTCARVPLVIAGAGSCQLKPIYDGRLADIAPTMLHIMGLPIPSQMMGRILVEDWKSAGGCDTMWGCER